LLQISRLCVDRINVLTSFLRSNRPPHINACEINTWSVEIFPARQANSNRAF
jgi:hypothetical protein